MTYEQYWYGDVHMVRAFLEADKQRQIRKNQDAWLQGAYFVRALDAVVGNAFRQKGQKAAEYPEKPIELTFEKENKNTQEPTNTDDVDQEALFAKAYMKSMMRVGKNWGN